MFESRKGITVELTDIQPGWLKNRWIFLIFVSSIIACLFAMIIPVVGLSLGLTTVHYEGFIIGFAVGWFTRRNLKIKPSEIRKINLKKISLRNLISYLCILFFLLSLPILLTTEHLRKLNNILPPKDPPHVNIILSLSILLFSSIFYLAIEFIFTETKRYPRIINPFRRLFAPYLFSLLQLTFSLFFGLILYSVIISPYAYDQIHEKKVISIGQMILASTLTGILAAILLNPILDFIIIQIILFLEKSTPLNVVKFLNIISNKTGLMEKDGGQWRFRHKLIQDEFNHVEPDI